MLQLEVGVYENIIGCDRVIPRSFCPMLHVAGATWADLLMTNISAIKDKNDEQRYAMNKLFFEPKSCVNLSRLRLSTK